MELSNSDWIATSAAIIALASIFVSLWQGYLTRKHNILSVKPHLSFEWELQSNSDVGCTIKNDGLGTAFITKLSIENCGDVVEITDLYKYLDVFGSGKFDEIDVTILCGVLIKNATISANQAESLVWFKRSANREQVNKEIIYALRDVSFTLEYKCIYGITYTKSGRVPM